MNITLHLTNDCNMRCSYCYVNKDNIKNMTFKTAKAAVDLVTKTTAENESAGIIFFGGEPLLCKPLIKEIVNYTEDIGNLNERYYHFKITTNGLLIDDEFLEFSKAKNIFIALSMDGIMEVHDKHRITEDGGLTFSHVEKNAFRLLNARPYAPVLMTINPDTVEYYADSVKYLYNLGFRYIICSLNYAADWNENDIEALEKQYKTLSDFYYRLTLKEEKFYLSPFEVKISSHINRKTYKHERCELGKKQISVSPDGLLYPCVQFVGDVGYAIGDVLNGIDEEKREFLYNRNDKEKDSCIECAVKNRCNHYCGCMNKQSTGNMDTVSPVQCAHERMLLPIADNLAFKLFRKKSAMFIQKHYNDYYPLISMVEDRTMDKKRI